MEYRIDNLLATLAKALSVLLLCVSITCAANAEDRPYPIYTSQALDPFVVYGEVAQLTSEHEVWPGFNIVEMPIAIYDGTNTYLYYHPNPPAGFVQNPDREAISAYLGRYEAIVANTCVEINGALTATVMLDSLGGSTVMEAAAVLLHEAFHVFQMSRHPDWAANEADSFTYPVDNPEALALRRLESIALQKALGSFTHAEAASWAKLFLEMRRQRFALIPHPSAAYEGGIELMEGTAHYLQYKMMGVPASSIFPSQEFSADAVRARAYASGRAQCVLLDRLFPQWKEMLENGNAKNLDELLGFAVDVRSDTYSKQFSMNDTELARTNAKADVEELITRRTTAREDFAAIPGSAVIIEAVASPLMPRGFDPMNLVVLGCGDILHTRFLSLGGTNVKVEIWNHQSLTSGAADNPIFGGITRVVIRGLSEVQASEKDGYVALSGEGFTAALTGSMSCEGETIYIIISQPTD